MAEKDEEFDRIFKEKLQNHQVKPSKLAWERLEYQLPEQKPSKQGIWWAIAASVSIVLLSGWMAWYKSEQPHQKPQIAQVTDLLEEKPKDQPVATGIKKPQEAISKPIQNLGKANKPNPTRSKNELPEISKHPANNDEIILDEQKEFFHIASTAPISEETQQENAPLDQETSSVKLPKPLASIAASSFAETDSLTVVEDFPLYRVRIFSNGLKKGEVPNKNLITEMGKTVGKVESLLGKVDEGFVELQDKKNSLFATLTTRKQTEE